MAPVLTALMVGGRVGAGITAELGSMKVTEQIDAIRSLGADPIRKLVVPRMLALLVMLPMLTCERRFDCALMSRVIGDWLIASR